MKTCIRCHKTATCGCAFVATPEGLVCKLCHAAQSGERVPLDIQMELQPAFPRFRALVEGREVGWDEFRRSGESH